MMLTTMIFTILIFLALLGISGYLSDILKELRKPTVGSNIRAYRNDGPQRTQPFFGDEPGPGPGFPNDGL